MGQSTEVNSMKGHATRDETSQWILKGCYTSVDLKQTALQRCWEVAHKSAI
jgi:hypothetical protein